MTTQTVLEKEIVTIKERMSNIQTAWQASRNELETKEGKYGGIEANLKQLEYDALYSKNCLNAFKDQVATLLSDGYVKVEANEEQIKEKVKLLMTSSKDRGLVSFKKKKFTIFFFFFFGKGPPLALKIFFFLNFYFLPDDCINGRQNAAIGKPIE